MEIGKRLRTARKSLGWRLKEVAEEISYSYTTISNAETGADVPGRKLLEKLVEFYGIHSSWLQTGAGPMLTPEGEKSYGDQLTQNRSKAFEQITSEVAATGRYIAIGDPDEGSDKVISFATATEDEWRLITSQIVAARETIGQRKEEPAEKNGTRLTDVKSKIIHMPLGTELRPILGNIAAGLPQGAVPQSEEYLAVPARLAREVNFILRASGESMVDAGIFDGDLLYVNAKRTPRNGSTVAAFINGGTCLKTYVVTGKEPPYLKSQNKAFPPKISPVNELIIQGIVIGQVPRTP